MKNNSYLHTFCTRYMHLHHVLTHEHVGSSIGRNGKARSSVETMPCCPPPIPVTGQQAKQLLGCCRASRLLLPLFCLSSFVEWLTVSHISGLILVSSSLLPVLNLHHHGIMSGTCQKVHKQCTNLYSSIVNRKPATDRHTSTSN